MNRALRKTHLRLILVLTPVAVAIFVVSVVVRRAIPANPIPDLLQVPATEMQETGHRSIWVEGVPFEIRGLVDQRGKRFLEVTPQRDSHVADLLAYIGPGKNPVFDDQVRLLGSVYATCPVRFPLPVDSTQTLSEIYFYSGATRTVVGRVSLTDSSSAAP